LIDLVRVRTAQSLDKIMSHVGGILAEFTTLASPIAAVAIVKKDVALRVVGSLSELLVKKKELRQPLESLLTSYVIPDLRHANGFLRARASWVVQRYSNWEYSNPAHYKFVVENVFQNLSDPELPVQMESCTAITAIIRCAHMLEPFRPLIPGILTAFFKLIDQIGNEDVIIIFDSLIEKFGDEITPYAKDLIQQMVLLLIFFLALHCS
jgi:hypothetical protein